MKKALLVLGVCSAFQGCGPLEGLAGHPTENDAGRLVIVGGALDVENAAVYAAVLDGRLGDGPLCVIPTASSDPAEAIEGMVANLDGYGGAGTAMGVFLPRDEPDRARDPAVADELRGCSGFYFTGGSQSRILDVFLPAGDTTAAFRALRKRWLEGAVVAGSSAGAAMMSRIMISGGSSDEAVSHGVARSEDGDGVELRPGMGFFEPILDQHFLARGRIGRLIVAVIDPGSPRVGLGIDENTALVVDGSSAEVLGASGVVMVDGRAAVATGPGRATDVQVSLAGSGDLIDLTSFAVRRDSTKRELPIETRSVVPGNDPFERWALLRLISGLAAASAAEATYELAGATLTLRKADGFSASASYPAGGIEGTPSGLSAGPFRVDLMNR